MIKICIFLPIGFYFLKTSLLKFSNSQIGSLEYDSFPFISFHKIWDKSNGFIHLYAVKVRFYKISVSGPSLKPVESSNNFLHSNDFLLPSNSKSGKIWVIIFCGLAGFELRLTQFDSTLPSWNLLIYLRFFHPSFFLQFRCLEAQGCK